MTRGLAGAAAATRRARARPAGQDPPQDPSSYLGCAVRGRATTRPRSSTERKERRVGLTEYEAQQIKQANAKLTRSCSSTGSGCCHPAGIAGGQCSRPEAMPPSRRAGLMIPTPSRMRTGTRGLARSVGQIADHFGDVIGNSREVALIGHSFGSLLTRSWYRGLPPVAVAIDPAPFRGVLPYRSASSSRPGDQQRQPRTRHPAHLPQFRFALRQRRHRNRSPRTVRDLRGTGLVSR